MKDLHEILKFLFPVHKFDPMGINSDWVITNEDGTQRIEEWNRPEPKPTTTELDAAYVQLTAYNEAQKVKKDGDVYTLNGVDYQVPFMKDDADGLMQVNAAFTLGLTDTVIHFTNGTKMPIAAADFQAFALWFVTKRNAFFTA